MALAMMRQLFLHCELGPLHCETGPKYCIHVQEWVQGNLYHDQEDLRLVEMFEILQVKSNFKIYKVILKCIPGECETVSTSGSTAGGVFFTSADCSTHKIPITSLEPEDS